MGMIFKSVHPEILRHQDEFDEQRKRLGLPILSEEDDPDEDEDLDDDYEDDDYEDDDLDDEDDDEDDEEDFDDEE